MLYSVYCCIAYILGIIWGLNLQHVGLIPFFILIICMLVYKIKKKLLSNNIIIVLVTIFFLVGFLNCLFRYYLFSNKYKDEHINGKGEILQLLKEGDYYNKYLFRLDNKDKMVLYIPNSIKIDLNSVIIFDGRFYMPEEARNKGGFSDARYLYSQNIYGSIYISSLKDFDIIDYKFDLINFIRTNIYNVLGRLLPKDQFGIILGMLIGDTFYISDEIEESFRISGISHLLAVSGTNVAYIIIFTKFIFDRLFGKSISNYISIIFIIIFVLIAGSSPSVLRAGLMAIIVIFSDILSKNNNIFATISVTALIILIYNPLIICDVGFILSFLGTIGIVLLSSRLSIFMKNIFKFEKLNFLFDIISVTLSAQIILVPIICYYFNTISFISLLTNVIVAPFVGIVTILGLIAYILGLIYFPLAQIISYPLYILISLVIHISKILSLFPFSNILVPTPSITLLMIYYLILGYIFLRKSLCSFYKNSIRLMILILIFIVISIKVLPRNYVEINVIDVGQGDSIHISTSNRKNILIDCGGSEGSDYDVGNNVLVPYLLDNTNGNVDLVFISHFHEDHAEGLFAILDKLNLKAIALSRNQQNNPLYEEIISIACNKGVKLIYMNIGDKVIVDGVEFEMIYGGLEAEKTSNLNNCSMVIKMTANNKTMLFAGDAEIEEEQELIKKYQSRKTKLDVDILKVSHHGSRTSSSEDFLKVVSPSISLISCGVRNKFGHPNKDALERLKEISNYILRTDQNGEISLKIDKKGDILISTKLKT